MKTYLSSDFCLPQHLLTCSLPHAILSISSVSDIKTDVSSRFQSNLFFIFLSYTKGETVQLFIKLLFVDKITFSKYKVSSFIYVLIYSFKKYFFSAC